MLKLTDILLISGQFVRESSVDLIWDEEDVMISRTAIFELIEECFATFETATQEIYDRFKKNYYSMIPLIEEIGYLRDLKEL